MSGVPSILASTDLFKIQLDNLDRSLIQESSAALQRHGYAVKDLAEWAWIVSAQDVKMMIERFISTPSPKPIWLLLVLLKRGRLDVRSFKSLLIYSWDRLLQIRRTGLTTKSEVEMDSIIPWSTMSPARNELSLRIEQTSFFAIYNRLIYHALQVWPAAIVSISHMVEPFIHLHTSSGSGEGKKKIGRRRHARLCWLYNRLFRVLSLPSSINPLKSMVHNWQAQRVLLKMSTHFEPALLLDRSSYRAVTRVLAASKRSARESKAATFRTTSWPPWRVEQDGMDAKRLPEDDLSRVIVTLNQAKASGYSAGSVDRGIGIIGGQESDGTPTIPTRTLSNRIRMGVKHSTSRAHFYRGHHPSHLNAEALIWAARIESTRDVQEAWAAFSGFRHHRRDIQPTMSMYRAIITKLIYESKRLAKPFEHTSAAGGGREVLPPANDNYSSFYQSRLQPPSLDELYTQMRRAGIQPSGRLLTLLVEHAQTPDKGIGYLMDSGLDERTVLYLRGGYNARDRWAGNPVVLKYVREETFAAFISLLCRFAPRIVPAALDSTPQYESYNAETNTDGLTTPGANGWKVLELRIYCSDGSSLDPLLHCANLLKLSRTRFRPAWYAFFRGLVRRDVILYRSLIGDPKNDIMAWKVLVAALADFHKRGLELDPYGFHLLCIGFEKALQASFKVPEEERELVFGKDQLGIVVAEFMKLSEVNETARHPSMPKFLHPIEGAHLHKYVRVLGLSEDRDGLMYVLRWMVQYCVELDDIALQSSNGPLLIQRTLIALKVFLRRTEYEPEAERLVNTVGIWRGWPNDEMTQSYQERFSGETD